MYCYYVIYTSIVITTRFLLNILDLEILFVISFKILYVELAKVLWKSKKNCKTINNHKAKEIKTTCSISYIILFYLLLNIWI